MRVSRIEEGDIVRGVVHLKNRPCVVLKVLKKTVVAVPLTTETTRVRGIGSSTTKALSENRFLKEKSYFTFNVIQISMEDAKKSLIGLVDKRTLKAIKSKVQSKVYEFLKEE